MATAIDNVQEAKHGTSSPEDAGKHEEREHTKRVLAINGCRVLTQISKTVDDAAHVETCETKPRRTAADIFAAKK
jgi:hypothetical protein